MTAKEKIDRANIIIGIVLSCVMMLNAILILPLRSNIQELYLEIRCIKEYQYVEHPKEHREMMKTLQDADKELTRIVNGLTNRMSVSENNYENIKERINSYGLKQ